MLMEKVCSVLRYLSDNSLQKVCKRLSGLKKAGLKRLGDGTVHPVEGVRFAWNKASLSQDT